MKRHVNFGIDAPRLFMTFVTVAIASLVALAVLAAFSLPAVAVSTIAVVGSYTLAMSIAMFYGSRIWKVQQRDLFFSALTWTGTEQVLDLGCGRGLMLIGAAERLTTGRATGIDMWVSKDQNANSPQATLRNASLRGVEDRVVVETGDIRALPFTDEAFDLVVSHWVIHNLEAKNDRLKALVEAVRVLKRGGRILVADIGKHEEYRTELASLGLRKETEFSGGAYCAVVGALSFESFRPTAQIWQKP